MTPVASVNAEFPDKLRCLFTPARTKVLWGGRGAGRSWGVARALLLLGAQKQIRVLCVRELQNSISESVHKLLSDQIVALGLENMYEVQVARIIGKTGTTFSFEGIKNNTSKIKSYEGIDICWVEEAIKVSRNSWGILIPTIRKPDSEIWMTFNPELETDYTYQRFVVKPATGSIVVKMTWRDNPWFPDVLQIEMDDLRERDYDAYLNIWEGHPLQMLEGVVYAKQLRRAMEEDRITRVPWERNLPVDTFWDLGRADSTAIWFAQRVAMQYRVLAYFEDQGEDITHYLRECQAREYVYGTMYLPHDAKAKTLGTKKSVLEIVRNAYPDTRLVKKLSISDGINAARMIFPACWFDQEKCADGLDKLRRYKYKVSHVDGATNKVIYSDEPVHDENSHGADAFRYLGVAIKAPRGRSMVSSVLESLRSEATKQVSLENQRPGPSLGWMG